MFTGLANLFDQSGLAVYFSPGSGLKYANVNKRSLRVNALRSALLAKNSHLFTLRFLYFLETLCPYFEKYGHTSILLANFCTNTVKYRQVGRSVIIHNDACRYLPGNIAEGWARCRPLSPHPTHQRLKQFINATAMQVN